MAAEANWYHAHQDSVSRTDGKSAVGLIAYITGENLKDERTGTWCTRNHPGEVLAWGTIAPPKADASLTDPDNLGKTWNAVERSETRINSHVAEHWNTAASRLLSEDQHRACAQDIARQYSERHGVIVTWGIHKPTDHGDDRNWHYHFGANVRRVGADGIGEKVRSIVALNTRVDETRWTRKMIGDTINRHLELAGANERVSHLSYADRGIEREPMKHLGHQANQLELKGYTTEIGDFNRALRERQAQADASEQHRQIRIDRLTAEIHDLTLRKLKRISDGDDQMEFNNRQSVDIEKDQVRRLEMLREQREGVERFTKEDDDRQRRYVQQKDKLEEDRAKREASGDITSATGRWQKAAGENHNTRDREGALALAVGIEGAQFRKEQDTLREQERRENDPEKKKLLEMRRHIEACDYMQLQHEKNASISGFLIGKRDNEISNRDRERAEEWKKIGTQLREERGELQRDQRNRFIEKFSETRQKMERETRGNDLRYRRQEPERTAESGETRERRRADEHRAAAQPERAPAREMTDKEQQRAAIRERFDAAQNANSRDRDQVHDGQTNQQARSSRGGRSL